VATRYGAGIMTQNDILEVRNLKKYFDVGRRGLFRRSRCQVKALDGVNLSVKEGTTLALVGESGCGKTTLGRCILRLEEPTEGEINFLGQNVLSSSQNQLMALRREMQIIFQDPYSSLNPRMTVEDIIGEGLIIHGVARGKEKRRRVAELLEEVGLRPEYTDHYPHQFSGGQRQRICVARALALNPKLVVADEPVSALDVSIQAQILNLLVSLQQKFGLTYLFISHDLSVVRHISDKVAVMYLGHIVEISSRHEIYTRPLHPYTQALMSAVPTANPFRKSERILLRGDVPSPMNPPSGCTFHPRCRFKSEDCIKTSPLMVEIEEGHWVACHHPGGETT
jgi:oligopeptide transport system ATP-binding protein